LRTTSAWDDPALTEPDSPDGALSRAMAYAGAPCDIWRLDRLDDWHRVLAGVRFSSDWNAPHAAGQLRPARPDRAESVLRNWAGPILILHGLRDLTFPVSLARKLHAALPASTLAEIPDAAHMAHFDNPRRGSQASAASSAQRVKAMGCAMVETPASPAAPHRVG
jgi:pimeloyl-ACP methyl ester carboxylesterase